MVNVEPTLSILEMRMAGMRCAWGRSIAVVGDRYEVQPGWGAAALASDDDVIAGCVAAPPSASQAAWASYLAEYSHVAPPLTDKRMNAAEAGSVPGGNVVYCAAAIENTSGKTEAEFHGSLFLAGCIFRWQPALAVCFAHAPTVREYIKERYAFSRDWARAAAAGRSVYSRWASALTRAALPAVLIQRRARNVFQRRRNRWRFVSVLPYLILFSIVEAMGECAGFVKRVT